MIFFKPSFQFCDWLVKYAAGRTIYDVGCGEGQLLRALIKHKAKVIGIDPLWLHSDGYDIRLPVLPLRAEECSALRDHPGLIVLARPSHGGWATEIAGYAHPRSEMLYISKPSNVGVDFNEDELQLVDAPKCEEELVWSVRRYRVQHFLDEVKEQYVCKETP